MKFALEFSETYPHPIEEVWAALTDRNALGQWLMETDFVPEKGRAFKMWCDDGSGGTDVYHCMLLEYEPQRRLVWSWHLASRISDFPTKVEFQVEDVEGGTKVTVTHSGDRDTETIEKFRSGWPTKLGQLRKTLTNH